MSEKIKIDDIKLMDEIFNHQFKNNLQYRSQWYIKNHNINKSKFEYLLNLICQHGGKLNLVVIEEVDSNEFMIVNFNQELCDIFLKEGGFKNHFESLNQKISEDKEYEKNLYDSVKPKPWYKRQEIFIPAIIGIITLVISTCLTLYISSKEQPIERAPVNRIIEISDSVSISYQVKFDSLLNLTNTSITHLRDSLNYNDSILKP